MRKVKVFKKNRLARMVAGAGTILEIVPSDRLRLPSLKTQVLRKVRSSSTCELRLSIERLPRSIRIQLAQDMIDNLDDQSPAASILRFVLRQRGSRQQNIIRESHGEK